MSVKMEPRPHFTAPDVFLGLVSIMMRNPYAVNPNVNGYSLYSDRFGPFISRCLIGHWGFEHGLSDPPPRYGDVEYVVEDIWSKEADFEPASVIVLREIQFLADRGPNGNSAPIPWGQVLMTLSDEVK